MSHPNSANVNPASPSQDEDSFKLPIEGFKGSPEEVERQWFEQIFTIEVTLRRSDARPEATGRLKTQALAFNLSAWLDLGPRARLGVAAGPAWLRTSGNAESLVFTSYTLGGHSVSFSEDYLVSFDFATSGLGLDVGGFVEADLGRAVGVRFDVRYGWGPERDVDVTLREIVNAGEIIRSITLAEIEAGLAPPPLRLDPSFFSASLQLALRF